MTQTSTTTPGRQALPAITARQARALRDIRATGHTDDHTTAAALYQRRLIHGAAAEMAVGLLLTDAGRAALDRFDCPHVLQYFDWNHRAYRCTACDAPMMAPGHGERIPR